MENETTQFIVKFDYNLAQMQEFANQAKTIDKSDIGQVAQAVKDLVKVRRRIEEQGKSFRDEANAYNKRVLAEQKQYIGIIEPLELEYKAIMEQEAEKARLEIRKEQLPMRKKQLAVLKIEQPADEELLKLDDQQWLEFYNQKFAEHEANVEAEVKKAQEEVERQAREEQIRQEAEEKARHEQEEALKRAEQEKEEAIANLKREQEEKERKAKEAEEAKQQAEEEEKRKTEANKKYQNWLKENGCTQDTKEDFHIENKTDVVILYKKVGIFTK